MATAVANKEISTTDHMAAAKSALAAAEVHVAALTGAFQDTILAGGLECLWPGCGCADARRPSFWRARKTQNAGRGSCKAACMSPARMSFA